MKNFTRKVLSFAFLLCWGLVLLTGCTKIVETDQIPQIFTDTKYLVSATLVADISAENLTNRYGGEYLPLDNELEAIQGLPGIKVYKLVYKTKDADGNDITASGAFLYPINTSGAKPLLSYQHGTITTEAGAPSSYGTSADSFIGGTFLASLGYVVSMPDYLGYGENAAADHPYEHRATLASASLDMLRASKEFSAKQNIELNNQLFLTGYSEGGSATTALHQLIESSASSEFTITASTPAAGAYDKITFAKNITVKDKPMLNIKNYSWVILTYNKLYGLNRPLTYYFNEPYATNIANQPEGEGITIDIEQNPTKLFTAEFRNGLLNDTDTEFLNALRDNSTFDWKPNAPLRLIHGTADEFVLFVNSQSAFDKMTANGATNVTLFPINGTGHFESVPAYVIEVSKYFDTFR
ncbi:alpha/beta hydrolase family protein [Microscilla marina]|nr:lipase family protein [Microscilla marina]